MHVKANGDVLVVDFTARFSVLPNGRLTIAGVPLCSGTKGLYRWKIASGLTLTKLRDTWPPEVGLFSGVWKHSTS